jgi:glycerol-3-phosphate dehydrogenase
VEAVEHEWALTIEDVLRRRTQLELRDPSDGSAIAADVAALMAERLGWEPGAARAAADRYVESVRAGRRRWR